MNRRRDSAFTIVELLIVTSIMMVMTGVFSSLWVTIERMNKASAKTVAYTINANRILQHLSKDLRRSIRAARSNDDLLHLTQLTPGGNTIDVFYRIENNELLRRSSGSGLKEQIVKIATLDNTWLDISFQTNGLIRLEIKRIPNNKPLGIRPIRLVTYVSVYGAES